VGARRLVLSVERLDYTKGIIEKLRGIGEFFSRYPEYRNKVAFLQVAVPSRTEVRSYAGLRSKVEEMVGNINGKFSSGWQVPVRYKFSALDPADLVAHYCAADVMLVTPLRDGLNLVAKEYVACRTGGDGALVLSPFAGAAEQLKGCILVNPYDRFELAEKIKKAVDMPEKEQKARMILLQRSVRQYDLQWWWRGVLAGLARGDAGTPPAKTSAGTRIAAGGFIAKQQPDG
jgi:trehalose 6-phosphate synthase